MSIAIPLKAIANYTLVDIFISVYITSLHDLSCPIEEKNISYGSITQNLYWNISNEKGLCRKIHLRENGMHSFLHEDNFMKTRKQEKGKKSMHKYQLNVNKYAPCEMHY